jgi:hypothetical protein
VCAAELPASPLPRIPQACDQSVTRIAPKSHREAVTRLASVTREGAARIGRVLPAWQAARPSQMSRTAGSRLMRGPARPRTGSPSTRTTTGSAT